MKAIIFPIILIFSIIFPAKTTLISGLDTPVVVDLTILNEKRSNINCPSDIFKLQDVIINVI